MTWLQIFGTPCHAWKVDFFTFITSPTAVYMCMDDNTSKQESLDVACVLVRTNSCTFLNEYFNGEGAASGEGAVLGNALMTVEKNLNLHSMRILESNENQQVLKALGPNAIMESNDNNHPNKAFENNITQHSLDVVGNINSVGLTKHFEKEYFHDQSNIPIQILVGPTFSPCHAGVSHLPNFVTSPDSKVGKTDALISAFSPALVVIELHSKPSSASVHGYASASVHGCAGASVLGCGGASVLGCVGSMPTPLASPNGSFTSDHFLATQPFFAPLLPKSKRHNDKTKASQVALVQVSDDGVCFSGGDVLCCPSISDSDILAGNNRFCHNNNNKLHIKFVTFRHNSVSLV